MLLLKKELINLKGCVDMILEGLFEEFYKELNAETYRSKVDAFKEFVIVEKRINDGTYEGYFSGIKMDTVLDSLGYFIERNNIKKETVAIHYGRMIKRFFYFLQSKGIRNENIFELFSRKDESSFDNQIKDYILNGTNLEKPEANDAYEDEEIIAIIVNANSIIQNSLENKKDLFSGKKRYSFKMYMAAVAVKLIIFSGTSFRNLSKIEIADFNEEKKTIKISGYELHLPIDLYRQIKEYIQIRSSIGTKNTKLFVKSDGANLKGVSDLEAALILSNDEKGNVTGIIKNIIIKMIKADIRFDIIMKLTDTGWKTVKDCIDVVNKERYIRDNEELDIRLRCLDTYILL